MKRQFLAAAAMVAVSVFVFHPSPSFAVTMQPVLDDAEMSAVVAAAKQDMAARHLKGCIAIDDADGVNIFFEREAGAYTNCNGSALVKAKAAAEFQGATVDFMNQVNKQGQTHLLAVPDMAPLPGGYPLTVHNVVVGGLGVSTPDGDTDVLIVAKAAKALK
ncbi:GlcG/HbpS family heme-binding protein [Acidisoma silvae]|uniref:Heme-binding protein n=1 Tax=Acidisoma silvae TaxID=2802396 RepID=A0A964DZA8_9PROT|nr:heme-binding protein [Acidisoma silvae]MCB8875927.1 heme-binding protein [Acidisoma silvae]